MPIKHFEKYVDDDSTIFVFFETEKGVVQRFTVKLIYQIHELWYEIVRYDSGHGIPHKDVLTPEGRVAKKIWYNYMNNNQALDYALDEMNEQIDFYKWRFEQWLKPKPQQ